MIIDLGYVKKEQNKFLEHLSKVKGYNIKKIAFVSHIGLYYLYKVN